LVKTELKGDVPSIWCDLWAIPTEGELVAIGAETDELRRPQPTIADEDVRVGRIVAIVRHKI
jgi:hypothetical protein